MKALVFGLGSVGRRHAVNLRTLRPECYIVAADPIAHIQFDDVVNELHSDWRTALAAHSGADCVAIIASPPSAHLEQMDALIFEHMIPFYVEKPIGSVDQLSDLINLRNRMLPEWRCAVGFQYRFHPVYIHAARVIRRNGDARFYARDDLIDRYGPNCLNVMAAHPIDTALWLFGPAREVDMQTDGVSVSGTIQHKNGRSQHDYRIDGGTRVSTVTSGGAPTWELEPSDRMYVDALSAWLGWVEDADYNPLTATLKDGCEVMEVMHQVIRRS